LAGGFDIPNAGRAHREEHVDYKMKHVENPDGLTFGGMMDETESGLKDAKVQATFKAVVTHKVSHDELKQFQADAQEWIKLKDLKNLNVFIPNVFIKNSLVYHCLTHFKCHVQIC